MEKIFNNLFADAHEMGMRLKRRDGGDEERKKLFIALVLIMSKPLTEHKIWWYIQFENTLFSKGGEAMDIKTGIIILGELLFSAALIYLFQQEEKVLEIENRLTKKIKGASLKRQRAREVKKQKKLNKKALYIPLRENNMTAETKAA